MAGRGRVAERDRAVRVDIQIERAGARQRHRALRVQAAGDGAVVVAHEVAIRVEVAVVALVLWKDWRQKVPKSQRWENLTQDQRVERLLWVAANSIEITKEVPSAIEHGLLRRNRENLTPRAFAKRVARTSGVNPDWNPVAGSPSTGRSSLYLHRFPGRCARDARSVDCLIAA